MGKKRRTLTSNKFNSKRSAWLDAVRKTETLTEQVEEAIETVRKTNNNTKAVTETTWTAPALPKENTTTVKPVKKTATRKTTTTKRKTTKKTTK